MDEKKNDMTKKYLLLLEMQFLFAVASVSSVAHTYARDKRIERACAHVSIREQNTTNTINKKEFEKKSNCNILIDVELYAFNNYTFTL